MNHSVAVFALCMRVFVEINHENHCANGGKVYGTHGKKKPFENIEQHIRTERFYCRIDNKIAIRINNTDE